MKDKIRYVRGMGFTEHYRVVNGELVTISFSFDWLFRQLGRVIKVILTGK